MKIGRNAPCLCNSGKKYKKCCMRKTEEQKMAEAIADIWDDLMRHMPEDMCKKLTYALSRKQDCFHKR